MEKYYGIQTTTLNQMLRDLMEAFIDTTQEMGRFPKDVFLPGRAERIQTSIREIMDELHNRNNV